MEANEIDRELENMGSYLMGGDRGRGDADDLLLDAGDELKSMGSYLMGADRGWGDADALLLDAGDEVRSTIDNERELEKKVSGLRALASPASALLCLDLVCEEDAEDVKNLRSQ